MEEGCLSYPDMYLDVPRPESVVVKYEDEGKKVHKIKLEGLNGLEYFNTSMIIWKGLIFLRSIQCCYKYFKGINIK